jgi:hypothetical protein
VAYNTGLTYKVLSSSISATTISANQGYVPTNNGTRVVFTLPTSGIKAGSVFAIAGFGTAGWSIAQNSGQLIHFGNQITTLGATGGLESVNNFDGLQIVCIEDDSIFTVVYSVGNINLN